MDYLYHRLPMFTRDGAVAFKKDLANTLALCELMGNPHKQFRSIHVAGTNGKGSTSHTLASIFQHAGYRTGLYTSPHLVDFRERIRINGERIPEARVTEFVARYQDDMERIKPSFFEVTVAMAFQFFAAEKVEMVIVETGMGGRLDSTNIIHPELSIITNIGWDHADMLGDTLPAIAREKAGIIKPLVPVVISEYQEAVAAVFTEIAASQQSTLTFASKIYESQFLSRGLNGQKIAVKRASDQDSQTYLLDLQGSYQAKNLIGIMAAVDQLREQGWNLPDSALSQALASVQRSTGLRGRWEILSAAPLVVCDTGHNEDGWREILQNIALTPHRQLHLVIGVMRDKDLSRMLPLLPADAQYYFCQVDMPRALPAEELAEMAKNYNLTGLPHRNVQTALTAAKKQAKSEDLIFVGGSTFIVGELLAGQFSS